MKSLEIEFQLLRLYFSHLSLPASLIQASSSIRMDSFQNITHTVMDSHIDPSSSWVTVMCRATRFHITVSHKDIRKSRFETEYSEMVAKAIDDEDGEDHDVLCEWIIDPCLSHFRETTLNVSKEITFQDFYYPSTHHLKLLVSGGLALSQGYTGSWDYECFQDDYSIWRPSTLS